MVHDVIVHEGRDEIVGMIIARPQTDRERLTRLAACLLEQARLQLMRDTRVLPKMELNPEKTDLFGWAYEDFTLTGYDPHPHIKAAVTV